MEAEYFEEYIKENLGIPYVNFSGLETPVIEEIVEALTLIMQKYPNLKKSICSIGNFGDINVQYNLVNNAFKQVESEWKDFVRDDGAIMITCFIQIITDSYIFHNFIGIAYGEALLGKDIGLINDILAENAITGFHPKHSNSLKHVIFHEIGHVLEFILNLKNDKVLYELISQKSNGFKEIGIKISDYAEKNGISEIIAEAFSEYIVSPNSNDLVNAIGTYMDEKYRRFSRSKVFVVNDKFWNHTLRAKKYFQSRSSR